MNEKQEILRAIPQVEKILQHPAMDEHLYHLGRHIVLAIVREETDRFRELVQSSRGEIRMESLMDAIFARCRLKRLEKLQRVINATGVLIHTNFGRSPLGRNLLCNLPGELSGYVNLEYHIPTRKRGKRGGFAEELMCRLTGAEDALIVNNNAAAVFLLLNELTAGREVVVSRGELVQIGGGFRVPEIMARSGARLVEVGTTNITTLDDYRAAMSGDTAMVFSVHRSNFFMGGFTDAPSLRELSSLKSESVLVVRDLGSGNLLRGPALPQPFEPDIAQELAEGADLVCFSGDKLLGSCQAGFIVGRADLIARLRKNQLMRILRVDKVTYYLTQEALLDYSRGEAESLPVWNLILQKEEDVIRRLKSCLRRVDSRWRPRLLNIQTTGTYGGGAMPGAEIPSRGLAFDMDGVPAEIIHDHFITSSPPVAGVIENGRFVLDFIAVADADIIPLTAAINAFFTTYGAP